MNSIRVALGAIAITASALFNPQVSKADTFTGADLLKWSEASQVAYLQNAIIMAMTVSSRMSETHAACISEWFFEADGFRDARLADLNGAIEKYADYHPGGVIVAIVERECGAFGQN